jgi:hypothetical protein
MCVQSTATPRLAFTSAPTDPSLPPPVTAAPTTVLPLNTHVPTTSLSQASVSAVLKNPSAPMPTQSRPEVTATPDSLMRPAPATKNVANGIHTPVSSFGPSLLVDEQRSVQQTTTSSISSEPEKAAYLPSLVDDKVSNKGDTATSRSGVWEHRVIYERDESLGRRSDDRRRSVPGTDDRRHRIDDWNPRPREDPMEVDPHDRERPPLTPARDDRHFEPGPLAPRSVSVASSDRSDKKGKGPVVLVPDNRKLPQDRLFPPDDPRAPIDRSKKPSETIIPDGPGTSTSSVSPSEGKIPASKPTTSPVSSTPISKVKAPVTAKEPDSMNSAGTEVVGSAPPPVVTAAPVSAAPAPAPAPASALPKPQPIQAPPSGSTPGLSRSGGDHPRSLADAPPLVNRPHRPSVSSATAPNTPEGRKAPVTPVKQEAKTPTQVRDPKEKPIARSMSLLDRLSDAPLRPDGRAPMDGRQSRRQSLSSGAPPPARGVGPVKPKVEPVDDRVLLNSSARPPPAPPARNGGPMIELRGRPPVPPPRHHDMTHRLPDPPKPASYSRPPPHIPDRRPLDEGRRPERPPPSIYERPGQRPPDPRGGYPDDYARPGSYRGPEWPEYDRRREYDDRFREPIRPTLEERLGMPPVPAPGPVYREDNRYVDPSESRIRRRSPSPGAWGAPPLKRARDDAYPDAGGFYEDPAEALRRLQYENERLRGYTRDHYGHDNHHPRHDYYEDHRAW